MLQCQEILKTTIAHNSEDEYLQDLKAKFISNLHTEFNATQDILNYFKTCKTDLEFVSRLKKHFQWNKPNNKVIQKYKKSTELCIQFREIGNTEYKNGNIIKAIQAYNYAIVFGISKSEELGLAYGNRSAAFLFINELELAQRDIQLAFNNNVPLNLHQKLEQRRQKCIELLNHNLLQQQQQKQNLTGIFNYKEIADKITSHLFILKHSNENIPSVENFVDISYDENCGRKLIVTKDVPAGTPLIIEQPYVTVLSKELDWDLEHCHYCYKRILGGIPCNICVFAIFCDDQCLTNAMQSSHQYDHCLYPILHLHESHNYSDLMAIRIITKTGPQLLKEFQNLQQQVNKQDNEPNSGANNTSSSSRIIAGFNNERIYESSYLQIYHLISHKSTIDKEELSDILTKVFNAFVLTNLVNDFTTFFTPTTNENMKPDEENSVPNFMEFITSLLFHHFQNIRFNVVSFSELLQFTKEDMISNSFARGLFPTLSLSNHSCVPNTVHVRNLQHCLTSLVTLKPLKSGDEITISYGPKFTTPNSTVLERKLDLGQKYRFNCNCMACTSNWSSISTTMNVDECLDLVNLVKNCKNHVPSSNNSNKNNNNIAKKTQQQLQCKECLAQLLKLNTQIDKYEQQLREIYNILTKYENKLKNSSNSNNNNKNPKLQQEISTFVDFWDIVEKLKPCLQFFGSNFLPIYNLTQIAEELFKKAVVYYIMSQRKHYSVNE